jgi:hypothetical protein
MKGFACIRASNLLGRRRAAELSAAQSLRLEEHLSGCAQCGHEAALMDGLRELATSAPKSLSPVAREHAIRGAIAQAGSIQPLASPFARLWPMGALGAAALVAAAATFGLVLRTGLPGDEASQRLELAKMAAKPVALPPARVMSGEVEIEGRLYGRDTAIGAVSALRSADGATIALGHAVVELRPGTALRWTASTHELRLEEGRVVADVDPKAQRPFTVSTAHFAVLVLGTRFEVALDEVMVERGRVRVVATDGAVLAESLGAGEHLIVPLAAELEQGALDVRPVRHGRPTRKPARSTGAAKDPSALLIEARAHLAARRVEDARQSIDAALALGRVRSQRAEAMSLRAECALVEGDLATAVEAYLRVARAFAREPAGQNALFAAARLEAERGRSASAAALLERYLARYPRGRFVKEARTRLRELGSVLDHAP